MLHKIENDDLSVEAESFGAELKTLKVKSTGENVLWCGDPSVWGKTSPNLFPANGVIKFGGYRYDGVFYPMTRHGFARDFNWRVIQSKTNGLKYELKPNANISKMYPYAFQLTAEYLLNGKSLSTIFTVKNEGGRNMYFQIGGHTAFSLENGTEKMRDYSLVFDREFEMQTLKLDLTTGLVSGNVETLKKDRVLKLTPELFDQDALIFENIPSKSLTLRNGSGAYRVQFDYGDYRNLAVWATKGTDRFVCLEPWTTLPDSKDFDGELPKKCGVNCLAAGESRSFTYVITPIRA